MRVPDDPPSTCPVCGATYDSVSVHEAGVMVNLLDNERFRRVCFEPVATADRPGIEFYHHTHAQTRAADGREGSRGDGSDGNGGDAATRRARR